MPATIGRNARPVLIGVTLPADYVSDEGDADLPELNPELAGTH
jgi:hypothetical protein